MSLKASVTRSAVAPPPGHSIRNGFALSPDGRRVVIEAVQDETGAPSLWLRDLDNSVPVRLAGTDGGTLPFWSPDAREIAFFADGKLKKTDLQGSPPQIICDAPGPRGGAWGDRRSRYRVMATHGRSREARSATEVLSAGHPSHDRPIALALPSPDRAIGYRPCARRAGVRRARIS